MLLLVLGIDRSRCCQGEEGGGRGKKAERGERGGEGGRDGKDGGLCGKLRPA